MATNVSKPIWRCDICWTSFGVDEAAALRCESAGLPEIMPDGQLYLELDHSRPDPGFRLRRLFHWTGHIGTVASSYNGEAGHTVPYLVDLNPADQGDGSRFPREPKRVGSEYLWPHRAGYLNVRRGWFGSPHSVHEPCGDKDAWWILDAVGLPRSGLEVTAQTQNFWMRPLRPEVVAVLDALEAHPGYLPTPDPVYGPNAYPVQFLGRYALGLTAAAGVGNARRAAWFLRSVPTDALKSDLNTLWRRWRAGEDVHVPSARLRSARRNLTFSKLSKELKALVAAAGVEWPARTNASEYANILVDKTSEYRMETDNVLFSNVHVIAVHGRKGGVGKSTVAAALARRLAAQGARVVLVDFDLTGPSQHIIHDLGPALTRPEAGVVLPTPVDVPGLSVFSAGQVFGPGVNDRWTEITTQQWLDFVGSSLDLGDADTVVVDMPPGDNAVHTVMSADYLARRDVEVHVTTGHPLALADTERDLTEHDGRDSPYVVENMAWVSGVGPDGQPVRVRLHGTTDGAAQLAERSRARFAGSLPWATTVAELASSDEVGALADLTAAPALPGEPVSVT